MVKELGLVNSVFPITVNDLVWIIGKLLHNYFEKHPPYQLLRSMSAFAQAISITQKNL
jgi:hypothetical protein